MQKLGGARNANTKALSAEERLEKLQNSASYGGTPVNECTRSSQQIAALQKTSNSTNLSKSASATNAAPKVGTHPVSSSTKATSSSTNVSAKKISPPTLRNQREATDKKPPSGANIHTLNGAPPAKSSGRLPPGQNHSKANIKTIGNTRSRLNDTTEAYRQNRGTTAQTIKEVGKDTMTPEKAAQVAAAREKVHGTRSGRNSNDNNLRASSNRNNNDQNAQSSTNHRPAPITNAGTRLGSSRNGPISSHKPGSGGMGLQQSLRSPHTLQNEHAKLPPGHVLHNMQSTRPVHLPQGHRSENTSQSPHRPQERTLALSAENSEPLTQSLHTEHGHPVIMPETQRSQPTSPNQTNPKIPHSPQSPSQRDHKRLPDSSNSTKAPANGRYKAHAPRPTPSSNGPAGRPPVLTRPGINPGLQRPILNKNPVLNTEQTSNPEQNPTSASARQKHPSSQKSIAEPPSKLQPKSSNSPKNRQNTIRNHAVPKVKSPTSRRSYGQILAETPPESETPQRTASPHPALSIPELNLGSLPSSPVYSPAPRVISPNKEIQSTPGFLPVPSRQRTAGNA